MFILGLIRHSLFLFTFASMLIGPRILILLGTYNVGMEHCRTAKALNSTSALYGPLQMQINYIKEPGHRLTALPSYQVLKTVGLLNPLRGTL